MARRPKKGLIYFSKDVDYYDDFKIIDLLDRYGPMGQTVYDVILTIIYKEGYYIEISPDRLAFLVIRIVGNKWIQRDAVTEIIRYCVDIGLFDKPLFSQGVVTSVGIQQRYDEVTARNKVDKSRYWLLGESEKGEINRAEKPVSVAEKPITDAEAAISVAEKPISVTEMQQRKENKSKVNESKVNEIKANETKANETKPNQGGEIDIPEQILQSWNDFVEMRANMNKPLGQKAAKLIYADLTELSGGDLKVANDILKQSVMNSWQGLYPLSRERGAEKKADEKPKSSISSYDIDKYMKRSIGIKYVPTDGG